MIERKKEGDWEREREREKGRIRYITMQYDIHQRCALQRDLSNPRGVNFPQL